MVPVNSVIQQTKAEETLSMRQRPHPLLICTASALLWSACPDAVARDDDGAERIGQPVRTHYDGATNDLLTAGLGRAGLQGAVPGFADPLNPTAEELRRRAIFVNYGALVDVSTAGGYGTFWGPNVQADGTVTSGQGLIAGDESIAFASQPDGSRITVMVQVPDTYDPAHGCIVAAPSSGSRGVYGAIATAGEWGLKHGCAVAYTDKGTGTGFDDLQQGKVTLLRGEVAPVATAGKDSQFTADLSASERAAFNAANPDRFAFKHAHSQVNPEADWGRYVLQSIRFAFTVLKEKYPGNRINKRNTLVIASSVSNGGGASLRAAEQDRRGLIDGVAVAEPNVNPEYVNRFAIVQGSRAPVTRHSRTLFDYVTLQNVYEGCANAAPALAKTPLNLAASPDRCTALQAAGLLTGATVADQAAEAQTVLNDFGILPEQNDTQGALWYLYVPQSIAMTYANAYGRFSVADSLCGYSFAATAATKPAPLAPATEAILFSLSSGIPPTGGISLINDLAPAGPVEDRVSTADQDLRGALCLRSLALGRDAVTGGALSEAEAAQSQRIHEGIEDIRANGNLHGIPAVIVTGRGDDILPPNFASRAYLGLNHVREGRHSQLRYIEVTNAQHLDAVLGVAGLNSTYVPLHRYYIAALDMLYAHLRSGGPLPVSQVVHTKPRGTNSDGSVPALTTENVPPIAAAPGSDAITVSEGVVHIPE